MRYDSEGDELDEDDEDSEADAAVAEENPFSEIALEREFLDHSFDEFCVQFMVTDCCALVCPDLLCPLKHPSEIPTHPSMAPAYTSKALQNMTQAIETKLRQERALLWRAKNLYREFLGDSSWIPCGTVETAEDRWIFEPKMDMEASSPVNQNGAAGSDAQKDEAQESLSGANSQASQTAQGEDDQTSQIGEKDINMTDAQNNEAEAEKNSNTEPTKEPKSEEVDATIGDVSQHPGTAEPGGHVNGNSAANAQADQDQPAGLEGALNKDGEGRAADEETAGIDAEHQSDTQGEGTDKDAEMQDGSSPAPPRRMTTRARANTGDPHHDDEFSNRSSSPSGSLAAPHPLFIVPDSIRPDSNYGLPPNEADETKRLLWSYIQKQEETVRGFEHMMDSLLRASRMKEDVLEWCKAEGHVGEMSDGEDWYDPEKWGLAEGEELKKGADEDEVETVDDSRATGKRGRGRRA